MHRHHSQQQSQFQSPLLYSRVISSGYSMRDWIHELCLLYFIHTLHKVAYCLLANGWAHKVSIDTGSHIIQTSGHGTSFLHPSQRQIHFHHIRITSTDTWTEKLCFFWNIIFDISFKNVYSMIYMENVVILL